MKNIITLATCVILAALLAACGSRDTPTPFVPATLAATRAPDASQPAPTPAAMTRATQLPPRPSATPSCASNLTYLEDVNLPDGSLVAAGQALEKQWKVRNSGECSWDSRYRFKLVEGDALGATPEQALYPARAGSEAVLTLRLTAPSEPGSYRCAWQAIDPLGNPFGDPVYLLIEVP